MQQLFAIRQGTEANYEIVRINLTQRFSPDMNSMEVQDPEILASKRSEALRILTDLHFHNQKPSQGADDEVIAEVEDQLRNMDNQNKKDRVNSHKIMLDDIERIECSYLSFIELIFTFREMAKKDPKRDHGNFVKNMLIESLALNKRVQSGILACGKRWKDNSEARSWFNNFVKSNDVYKEYLQLEKPTFEDDRKFLSHLSKKIIFKEEDIDKYLEQQDLFWTENKPIVKSLISKTFKSASEEEVELQSVSYNFEDDKAFFVRLFKETIDLKEDYKKLISEKAKNWDVERLAATDRILLQMAIAEMIFFPSIPIKVTINEYIEISKLYSTPKSKRFINGMLDVIAEELKKSGDVKKSGRGLMDNK